MNRKPSYLKKVKNPCCSVKCMGQFKTKTEQRKCKSCKKIVVKTQYELSRSKSGFVFCSKSCSAKYSNSLRLGSGYTGYRNYAFSVYKKECDICGYSKFENVLEVHHKDRNRKNMKIENLQILCPTCHSEEHFLND
jgi:5-methylcytosine-specific restriction endonuclease McrA